MQSESSLNSAKVSIQSGLSELRSYLGFRENAVIKLSLNPKVPGFKVPFEEALNQALTRNPDIISYNIQILDAEETAARAKSQTGITMNLDASFGMNKTGYSFNEAYSPRFGDYEGIGLRITVPILDWNQTRNRYRQAQSSLELAEARVQQSETEFKQNVYLRVMRFNMQEDQLRIAAMSDTIAQKSYDISYARYMSGRGDITVLNLADTEKDSAKKKYMEELNNYWNYYYFIRQLTLFDFQNNKPLEEDFDLIIEN
jgi:outer membrane protein TolC